MPHRSFFSTSQTRLRGHVTVLDWNNDHYERYVSVFGLKWIDREDRQRTRRTFSANASWRDKESAFLCGQNR